MSGPTARGDPPLSLPKLRPAAALKVLLAFAVALGLWYLLRYPYGRVIAFFSDAVLSRLESADRVLRWNETRFELVTKLVRKEGGPPKVVKLADSTVYDAYWNLILFTGLVLSTPFGILGNRWRSLLLLSAILFLCHVVFFSGAMFLQLEYAYAGVGQPRHGETLMTLVAGAFHLYATILTPLLPFLLLAPIWIGRRREKPLRKRAPAGTGRNDPCPCGSGRKYKNCCGG